MVSDMDNKIDMLGLHSFYYLVVQFDIIHNHLRPVLIACVNLA